MLQFALKLVSFLGLVFGLSYFFLYQPLVEFTPGYAKATHRANSLILGGSRAGQGLNPDTIQATLGRDDVLLNFAFNGFYSPYGPFYFDAIKRKVIEETEAGLFILSVNVGLLSDTSSNLNWFREAEYEFYDLYNMNMQPNIEFMLRDIGSEGSKQVSPWLRLQGLKRKAASRRRLHPNGWMEMLKPTRKRGPTAAERFTGGKPNPVRIGYLKQTIAYLQQYGQVILVRIPTGEEYRYHELLTYPEFEEDMQAIAADFGIPYFNFVEEEYLFHDVNDHHLISEGANNFSVDLARAIATWQKDGRIEIGNNTVGKPLPTDN